MIRMQRGGFDIVSLKQSDFKYTKDPDRILWTKNVFPIGEYIAQAVMRIPWSSYTFEGVVSLWIAEEDDNNSFRLNQDTKYRKVEAQVSAKYPRDNPGYYFFGGCVYELMNALYRGDENMPSLRSFVDPTGDIDVQVIFPELTLPPALDDKEIVGYFFETLPPPENSNSDSNYAEVENENEDSSEDGSEDTSNNDLLNEPRELHGCIDEKKTNYTEDNQRNKYNDPRDGRRYNAFIDHFSRWILNRFAEQIESLKRGQLYASLFGNTVPFNLNNNSEGSQADVVICIGNLKLVRCYIAELDLIKIQLIAKFKNMKRSDHICEFLIRMPTEPSSRGGGILDLIRNDKSDYNLLKGVSLSSLKELMNGNYSGIQNRYHYYKEDKYRHKFFNHVQRMMYLQAFLKNKVNKFNEADPSKITLRSHAYQHTGYMMAKFAIYILEKYCDYKNFYKFSYTLVDFARNHPFKDIMKINSDLIDKLIGIYPYFLVERKYGVLIDKVGFGFIDIRKKRYEETIYKVVESLRYSKYRAKERAVAEALRLDLTKYIFTLGEIFEIFRLDGAWMFAL